MGHWTVLTVIDKECHFFGFIPQVRVVTQGSMYRSFIVLGLFLMFDKIKVITGVVIIILYYDTFSFVHNLWNRIKSMRCTQLSKCF